MTVGWPVATFLMVIYYLLIKPTTKGFKNIVRQQEWEKNKTDINPLTGSYTSKSSGRRCTKDGAVMWRDLDKEADMFVHVISG